MLGKPGEGSSQSIGVDEFWIEVVVDPLLQLRMTLMLGVADGFEKFGITTGAADIFGRTAPHGLDQARIGDAG